MFFLNPPSTQTCLYENTYLGYLDFKDFQDVYVKPTLNHNFSSSENTYLGYLDFKDFKDVFLNPPSIQTCLYENTYLGYLDFKDFQDVYGAVQQIKKLAKALSRQTGQEESVAVSHIWQRLSVHLMKGNTALLLNRFPLSPKATLMAVSN